jgi:hypothetical protein
MCIICSSELLGELNKKVNWRPERLIKWAGRRGLVVDEKQLNEHFNNHLKPSLKTTISQKKKTKSKRGKKQTKSANASKKSRRNDCREISTTSSKMIDTLPPDSHTSPDIHFLDEVISLVFQGLSEGEFDLKVEHGFKAIELKQKYAENSNVENLLLELLNEIRRQELPFLQRNNNHSNLN